MGLPRFKHGLIRTLTCTNFNERTASNNAETSHASIHTSYYRIQLKRRTVRTCQTLDRTSDCSRNERSRREVRSSMDM